MEAKSDESGDDGVETTQDEIEAFHIVRAILAKEIDPSRVVMRDTKSYCGILLDDNNRKPICRLLFNAKQKYLGLLDANKNVERNSIEKPCDIYKFANKLAEKIKDYEQDQTEPKE
ncbi:hypothetical protein OAG68_01765 [bacterium]|nr:hypothetical protein [bacterium]